MAEIYWEPLTERTPIGAWVVMLMGIACAVWMVVAIGNYSERETRHAEQRINVEQMAPIESRDPGAGRSPGR